MPEMWFGPSLAPTLEVGMMVLIIRGNAAQLYDAGTVLHRTRCYATVECVPRGGLFGGKTRRRVHIHSLICLMPGCTVTVDIQGVLFVEACPEGDPEETHNWISSESEDSDAD